MERMQKGGEGKGMKKEYRRKKGNKCNGDKMMKGMGERGKREQRGKRKGKEVGRKEAEEEKDGIGWGEKQ